jgi:hypothetical protein
MTSLTLKLPHNLVTNEKPSIIADFRSIRHGSTVMNSKDNGHTYKNRKILFAQTLDYFHLEEILFLRLRKILQIEVKMKLIIKIINKLF